MTAFIAALDTTLAIVRIVFLATAVVAVAVCGLDWAVRTRRISPFSGVARFFRSSIDPLLAPIERRVVRSGGLPSSAPWWALGAVIVGGILAITALGFLRSQLVTLVLATGSGPRGIVRLVISWAVAILQIALIVRVVLSWIRVSPYSRWVRWAFVLTEPILGPLRRVIPPIGMIDITPIVAYFLLWLLSGFLLSAV